MISDRIVVLEGLVVVLLEGLEGLEGLAVVQVASTSPEYRTTTAPHPSPARLVSSCLSPQPSPASSRLSTQQQETAEVECVVSYCHTVYTTALVLIRV